MQKCSAVMEEGGKREENEGKEGEMEGKIERDKDREAERERERERESRGGTEEDDPF